MKSFTYNLCKLLIDNGRTEELQQKLDVFFANDRLTMEEYTELCAMLTPKE